MSSARNWSSVNRAGHGCATRNLGARGDQRRLGTESSTSAPPAIQLQNPAPHRSGTGRKNHRKHHQHRLDRDGRERHHRVEQRQRGHPAGPADRVVDGRPPAEGHPHQMRPIQRQAGEHLVEPLRLVIGSRDRLVLYRQPRPRRAGRQRRPCGGLSRAGRLDPPHRSGRVAARQQHDRRPVDGPSKRYTRTVPKEVGTSNDSLDRRQFSHGGLIDAQEMCAGRIAAEAVRRLGRRHYSTVTDFARLRGLSTS